MNDRNETRGIQFMRSRFSLAYSLLLAQPALLRAGVKVTVCLLGLGLTVWSPPKEKKKKITKSSTEDRREEIAPCVRVCVYGF